MTRLQHLLDFLSHPTEYQLRMSPLAFRVTTNVLLAAFTAAYVLLVVYIGEHKNLNWGRAYGLYAIGRVIVWGSPVLLTVFVPLAIIGSLRSKPTQGWILSFSVCALITLGISLALFYQASTAPDYVKLGQIISVLSLIGTVPGAGFFIWLCTWVADYERDIRYGDKVISLTKRPSR